MSLLNETESNEKLKNLPDWKFVNEQIEKEYKLKDFSRHWILLIN